jgi:hypothetical protein
MASARDPFTAWNLAGAYSRRGAQLPQPLSECTLENPEGIATSVPLRVSLAKRLPALHAAEKRRGDGALRGYHRQAGSP